MFKLQRLEITGFKSFADYTELVFTGEGITAVVGPNGCGKSNVADAISWVLGEQRAKQLRGAEMKDVIFQGSRGRAAGGMAEVVLHLMRDETSVNESDIEDIDSALEEIDDQRTTFEGSGASETIGEKLVDEATDGSPQNVQSKAAAQADVTGSVSIAPAIAEAASIPTDESASSEGEPTATASSEAMTKARGKRHWRPSRIALEFAPGETVTVTRRLYLSGESEYLLNGRACRLRDIQDLFSGTGLAGAHYAIIEQGRIGQILSAKPMDRRTLIEEAAGITKFRVRQRAAEVRLEGARGNLHRLFDIISEIERQVVSLRRQATKARRYSQTREELRAALRQVFVADERALRSLLEELRTHLAEASSEEQRLAAELAAREEESRQATAAARASEEELAQRRAAAAAAALQRDRSERELAYQQEQVAALEQRLTEVEGESETVSVRLVSVEAEAASLREREAEVRRASEETARLVASAEAAYAERTLEVAQAEAEIEQTRTELLTHTAVTERLMEIGRQLEATLDRLAAQAEGLAREQVRAAAAHAESTAEAERININLNEVRLRLEQLAEEREVAVEAVTLARAEAVAATAEHARIRDEAARVRHRLDTLAELDAKRELYSEAVQNLFASSEAVKDFHSIGTLVDVLRVEPQWEQAVESALGPFLQSVIVPTPDDALRAALWLKEKNWGRATFLVTGLHGASVDEQNDHTSHTGVALAEEADDTDDLRLSVDELQDSGLRISDLLWAPTEILQVLDRTLTREMNAQLAETLDQAMIKSLATGDAFVTREGEWVAGGQLLSAGGSLHNSSGNAGGLLAFKREMRQLELRAAEFDQEVAAAAQAASAARHKLGELEEALVQLNEIIGREEREQMARELHAAGVKQDIERAERHLRVVADEAARLAEERREVGGRRATAATEAEAAEASRLAC
ncbi:MAG: AAA family ATPase, partial [Pyrinomonadaceae bacterium]|nr:AAA family ATPase [Pyrinomonadaceae bacterium]